MAPASSDALACTWLWSLSFTCEERPCRRSVLLCAEQEKVSVTTSESLKSLILQNYSQKIILVRWFIIQLGFIAWFIEGSAIWHICSLPERRDAGSLGSFLPSLNQWWLPKLIYHGPGWFATELFMLETGGKKSTNEPSVYLLLRGGDRDHLAENTQTVDRRATHQTIVK